MEELRIEVSENTLKFTDGRYLARYYPKLNAWSVEIWRNKQHRGTIRIPVEKEDIILTEALFNDCWIACTECEDARNWNK